MSSNIILLPAASDSQVGNLLPLVIPIALARQAKVALLHVSLATRQRSGALSEDLSWLDEHADQARGEGVPVEILHREGHNTAGVIRETIAALEPLLLVLSWSRPIGRLSDDNDLTLRDLLLDVPCDLVVWRGNDHAPAPKRILISSAGGPNTWLAVGLADSLSTAYDGEITLLSVVSDTADNEKVRQTHDSLKAQVIEYSEKNGGEVDDIRVQVIRHRSATEGILGECTLADYDLVMIGASQGGVLNRFIFGEVPERVARQAGVPVLIIKRPLSRPVSLARRFWDRLQEQAPVISEAEKIEAYRTIRRSARADTDFYTMTALSTAIAALGLMLDSPAVVIGAMLVAPLMSAIVALGLAVVQGDAKLLGLAVKTTARGVVVSVGIALLMGLLIPGSTITAEMHSRATPSLLDLAVALASGAAGAYALCRKDVSTSLPGVAIAVALVPPLATVGLALSAGAWSIAAGAGLLFLTNLVAIAAMGGFVFLLLGFQPEPGRRDRMRLFTRGWRSLILLLVVVSLLLAWFTLRTSAEAEIEQAVRTALQTAFSQYPDATLRSISIELGDEDVVRVAIEVETTHELSETQGLALQQQLISTLNRTVALTIKLIPTIELPALAPPSARLGLLWG
ncbi:MAG: DUF389 domain-containing protein [Chloroflexi bacterium]|nr:DUF389 domain-containing protein [Chloroflexota bacterium]